MNYSKQSFFILLLCIVGLFGCQDSFSDKNEVDQELENSILRSINIVDYYVDGDDRVIVYQWSDVSTEASYDFQLLIKGDSNPLVDLKMSSIAARKSNTEFVNELLSIKALDRTTCEVRMKGDYLLSDILVARVGVLDLGGKGSNSSPGVVSATTGPSTQGPGGAAVQPIGLPPATLFGAVCNPFACEYYKVNLIDFNGIGGAARTGITTPTYYKRQDVCDCISPYTNPENHMLEIGLCLSPKTTYYFLWSENCSM